jgi:hypothetical protein
MHVEHRHGSCVEGALSPNPAQMSGTFWGLMLASFCVPRSALDLGKERGHDSAGEGCVVVRDGSVQSAVCYHGAAGRFLGGRSG